MDGLIEIYVYFELRQIQVHTFHIMDFWNYLDLNSVIDQVQKWIYLVCVTSFDGYYNCIFMFLFQNCNKLFYLFFSNYILVNSFAYMYSICNSKILDEHFNSCFFMEYPFLKFKWINYADSLDELMLILLFDWK